jgi:PAS domain S-box-containing protein
MPKPLNILLVEDNADDAEMVLRELRRGGFDPQWTRIETEKEFLTAIKKLPDIVLSDYSMPQFSGLRAIKLLREHDQETPFILISGTVGEDVAVQAMKDGATDYLLKDRLARLGSAVKRALAETREKKNRLRAEMELRESELKFRQLAENINEVFWLTDPVKSQMLYVSQAYEKIWGRSCSSLYESPETWLDSVHPDDREMVRQAVITKQVLGEYNETYRIKRPDGSFRWIHDRAFPIRNEAGEVYRIVGTAEDITEHRKLEDQFRQAQKMEAIGQLAGGVAHDFNNILAVIQMQSDLMNLDGGLSAEQRECLDEIVAAARRAANLTRQLLLFSRHEKIQPHELDLCESISHMAKMLRRILGEDIQMHFKLPPEPLHIHADPGMIDQVVMNLAINSRDAMPQGGKLVIEISSVEIDELAAAQSLRSRPGSFACLSVSDSGCGISAEVLPRIFEPFFTTKSVGKGTGLGLATVFGIVTQHRGWIDVYSEANGGTTFRVFFPRHAASNHHPAITPAHVTAIRGGEETILLVEDDTALRAAFKKALIQLGYRVMDVDNAPAALELWHQHHKVIRLLLTDLIMPGGISGKEFAQKVLAQDPKLKVIYMSGYCPDITVSDLKLGQGICFLAKPFDTFTLAQTIRLTLDAA